QNKGPFLGEYSQTLVSQNVIDNPNGVLHYAETRTVPGGVINADTLATIHFTAIGPRGAKSDLNLTGVIIINNATIEPYGAIMVNNGTLEISSNIPPTPMGLSKHQINNVAKKYPCNTIICSCSYDMNYPDKGGNITYIRWDFGDGQYGTSEGLPDENNCTCKNHTYDSWQWAPFGDPNGDYVDFTVHLTVTDDGCPEETSTDDFPVTVYIAGDANGDGSVDIMDAAFVGMHWNECCCASGSCTCYPGPCNASVSGCMENLWDDLQQDRADLNNDCNINVLDAMITGANWGYTAWQ
ncbi:hypothetical protein KA005_43075, partial [bacterium]|nr:hypothetical protein [bacterium]